MRANYILCRRLRHEVPEGGAADQGEAVPCGDDMLRSAFEGRL